MTKTRLRTAALIFVSITTLLGFGIPAVTNSQRKQQAEAALAAQPQTGVTSVEMRDFAFSAPNIRVTPGTTVTWANAGDAQHTVTFRDGTVNSGLLAQGQSFRHTFTTPGVYDYYCIPHQSHMIGRVIVG